LSWVYIVCRWRVFVGQGWTIIGPRWCWCWWGGVRMDRFCCCCCCCCCCCSMIEVVVVVVVILLQFPWHWSLDPLYCSIYSHHCLRLPFPDDTEGTHEIPNPRRHFVPVGNSPPLSLYGVHTSVFSIHLCLVDCAVVFVYVVVVVGGGAGAGAVGVFCIQRGKMATSSHSHSLVVGHSPTLHVL